MATHSSILAWKTSWKEEPGGLQSMGSQRVRHDWATKTYNTYSNIISYRATQTFHFYTILSIRILRFEDSWKSQPITQQKGSNNMLHNFPAAILYISPWVHSPEVTIKVWVIFYMMMLCPLMIRSSLVFWCLLAAMESRDSSQSSKWLGQDQHLFSPHAISSI